MPQRPLQRPLVAPPDPPTRLFGQRLSSPQPDVIGTMVGGYRIEREIGRGGMGVVYSALHPVLGRRAAVKVLHPELSTREDLRERFISEARAAASVRHPHIVEIYDLVPLPDGRLCLVMEYLEGDTLEHRAGRTPMPAARVRSILLQLCGALATAHEHGIVHRDLKAQNVLLVTGGVRDSVKLLDFGLAKLAEGARPPGAALEEGATPPGMWIGSPHYMSPEQIMGEPVDHRADIYALGILAYRLLCGTVPFEGIATQVMYQQVHTYPREPSHVPPALRQILLKALAKRPDQRFADMTEFSRALQDCRLDAPPPRKPTPPPPLFTTFVEQSNIIIRFVTEEAWRQVERFELGSGRLFVPGTPPANSHLLWLTIEVAGRPVRIMPVEALSPLNQQAAEKYGLPAGFVVALRPAPSEAAQPARAASAHQERAERIPKRLAVAFSLPGCELSSGHTTDLSETGLGLASAFQVPVGIELFVAITLPRGQRTHGRAVVAWSRALPEGEEERGRAGLRITECDERYLNYVRSLQPTLDGASAVGGASAPQGARCR